MAMMPESKQMMMCLAELYEKGEHDEIIAILTSLVAAYFQIVCDGTKGEADIETMCHLFAKDIMARVLDDAEQTH